MKRSLLLPFALGVSTVGLLIAPYQVNGISIQSNETSRISAARCVNAKGRITNMIDTMQMQSERRVATYMTTYKKMNGRVEVLSQKGYDTTKFKADLETINAQVGVFMANREKLQNALADMQNTACEDSDGAFTSALQNARLQLKATRESSQAVHQTFRDKIIPDIKAAATWLKEN